ncbi:MAG: protein translocase subunit SecF [Gemmatimonadota bacterium]|jgi:preprotein translocase subunit SecF|nr:protein translocase subunit SecF [Gemmatimonadota bacterium]
MRIFANADYPFLRWRFKAYAVAALLLALGVLAMVVNAVTTGSWLHYGVDFTGGTLVQVDFHSPVEAEDIRAVNPDWTSVTRFGEPGASEYVIRVPSFQSQLNIDPASEVTTSLTRVFGEGSFQVIRTESVGPRVGAELQQRALLAIVVSMIGTLIYLALRFEWRFGIAAIIGTAYDVLISLGIIAVLRMEVDVTTVAAFLTIVGYSLNDTIVVFDRIRDEVGRAPRGTRFIAIANRAINETLPRTVITGGSTMLTLLTLFLFGGAVIRDFALVLILGIVIGTFTTVFIASPVLVDIQGRWPRKAKSPASHGGSRKRASSSV